MFNVFETQQHQDMYFDKLFSLINEHLAKYKITLDFTYPDVCKLSKDNDDDILTAFEKRIAQYMIENSFSKEEEHDLVKEIYTDFFVNHKKIAKLKLPLMQVLFEIDEADDYIIDKVKTKTVEAFGEKGVSLKDRDFSFIEGRLIFTIPFNKLNRHEVQKIISGIFHDIGEEFGNDEGDDSY